MDGPTGSTKAVSHIEGASLRVTGLNLDQWFAFEDIMYSVLLPAAYVDY